MAPLGALRLRLKTPDVDISWSLPTETFLITISSWDSWEWKNKVSVVDQEIRRIIWAMVSQLFQLCWLTQLEISTSGKIINYHSCSVFLYKTTSGFLFGENAPSLIPPTPPETILKPIATHCRYLFGNRKSVVFKVITYLLAGRLVVCFHGDFICWYYPLYCESAYARLQKKCLLFMVFSKSPHNIRLKSIYLPNMTLKNKFGTGCGEILPLFLFY